MAKHNDLIIIRRYQNRKLYDTSRSRYVTLSNIAEMIKEGQEVKVVDNKTKRDLTGLTLAQIIFEEEKRDRPFLPLSALRGIIQSGSESLHEIVDRLVAPGLGSVQQAKQEVEKAIDRLTRRGKLREEDRRNILKELYAQSQQNMEDIIRHVENNLAGFLNSFRGISALSAKVKTLEDEVQALEEALAEKKVKKTPGPEH